MSGAMRVAMTIAAASLTPSEAFDEHGVEGEREEVPDFERDLVRGDLRVADARRDRGRHRERDEQPIHREGAGGDTCFPWKPGEMLVGQPRASRGKAQEPGNA